jgi:multisubunit Na+/H+ antiporter MnhG subunit
MSSKFFDISGVTGKVDKGKILEGQQSSNLMFSAVAVLVSGGMIVGNLLISERFIEPITGRGLAILFTVFFNSAGELLISRALMTEDWRREQSTVVTIFMYALLLGMYSYDFISNLAVLQAKAYEAGSVTTITAIAVIVLAFLLCFSEWFFMLSWQFMTHDWKVYYDAKYTVKPAQKVPPPPPIQQRGPLPSQSRK